MDAMSSGDEYDAEPMSTDMLEDICVRSQYRPSVNSREARYKIHDWLKKRQAEWMERYYQREAWVKVYTRYLRLLLMNFHKN